MIATQNNMSERKMAVVHKINIWWNQFFFTIMIYWKHRVPNFNIHNLNLDPKGLTKQKISAKFKEKDLNSVLFTNKYLLWYGPIGNGLM